MDEAELAALTATAEKARSYDEGLGDEVDALVEKVLELEASLEAAGADGEAA